ncbi:sulfite exporter TauE/SafE family protein [Desulfovibrio sp. OttesenSCG-928-C06]|nr:sulfite exporter TauE/SafE family protein [Desulfovibrio sp. OttesenSCG-928-C06]
MDWILSNMATVILAILGIMTVGVAIILIKEWIKYKDELEAGTSWGISGGIGLVVNFFDTLGIGSFAPTTALLKAFKQTDDRLIPGILNVGCCIPVLTEALIFIQKVEVEPITLFGMLFASAFGAWVGAGIVSKFDTQKVRLVMGVALLITAFLMLVGLMGWMPVGGDAIGLTGAKLIVAIAINFVLGAMMTAGVGLYAPCMALVYLMGMSPLMAFPIMMGSCAMLMPVATLRFVKEKAYNRKASIAITIGGIIGVFIAVYLVTSLPMTVLRWLVIAVVVYTAIVMLRAYAKGGKSAA